MWLLHVTGKLSDQLTGFPLEIGCKELASSTWSICQVYLPLQCEYIEVFTWTMYPREFHGLSIFRRYTTVRWTDQKIKCSSMESIRGVPKVPGMYPPFRQYLEFVNKIWYECTLSSFELWFEIWITMDYYLHCYGCYDNITLEQHFIAFPFLAYQKNKLWMYTYHTLS